MRILFMGTPDFAAGILASLYEAGENIVGVFTQPGKPKGRGQTPRPSPVEEFAAAHSTPCYTPDTLKNEAALPILKELDPELIIVVAYGKILPGYVLDYPKHGCINIHASLLPRWRGAAPIQRAIIAGDAETGVTAMQMDAGLDTGDMLVRERVRIEDTDDFGSLHDKLCEAGKKAIAEALRQIGDGTLTRTPQPEEGMTYAEKIDKSEGILDFARPAGELSLLIRGLSPAPMAMTRLDGKLLKIAAARPSEAAGNALPGEITGLTPEGFTVACGKGALLVTEVVPEGKRRMTAAEFARGQRSGLCGRVLSWEA